MASSAQIWASSRLLAGHGELLPGSGASSSSYPSPWYVLGGSELRPYGGRLELSPAMAPCPSPSRSKFSPRKPL
ncbi:hypothetical protein NL676_018188 [Syzygium grande]|nr:hypothetical protein NL676_018188 [Syzygium grande]